MRYNPNKIEEKWRRVWLKKRVYEPDLKKAKRPFYNLMMFPYPSAEGLHIGSVRTFSGIDIYGRFKRMQGHDVFEPIGLDGFGIHSENYALKAGKHPFQHAKDSEKNFYRQLAEIGNSFAWKEKLETYDPGYYKWTQWIFTQMFKRGLAYRKKSSVNWCPSCLTVLADEQVLSGGCERCGTKVIKKDLEQWFFKITEYAERLLANLEKIDWPEPVKIAQRNWIGKSEGALMKFPLKVPGQPDKHAVEIFTTRPDTIFGATFIAVSPELAQKWLDVGWKADRKVQNYIERALRKRWKVDIEKLEKTGLFTGVTAVNPASKEEIPVWVVNYVLGNVGTGAIMAVPAHDKRDFEFAKKYKLPIRIVVEPETGKSLPNEEFRRSIVAIVEDSATGKFLALNWGHKLGGTLFVGGGREGSEDEVQAALREIKEETGYMNLKFIAKTERTHHHYFAFSKNVARQTEVIGLYFQLIDGERGRRRMQGDEKGNFKVEWLTGEDILRKMEDENHLLYFRRLILGEVYTGKGRLTDSGEFTGLESAKARWEITKFVGGERKVQYRLRDWLISRQRYWGPPIPMIFCDACLTAGRGEQKDMPGWHTVPEKSLPVKLPFVKDFRPTGKNESPLASVEKFYKVRCPACKSWARRETDVSDTFLDSAWYYLRYPSTRDTRSGQVPWDPVITKKWLPVDMYIGGAEHAVLHLLYVRFLALAFYDWKLTHFEEPFKKFRTHGLIIKDGAKMSKSRGNVVNPDEYIRAYGSDAIRMYLAFLAPLTQGGDFRDEGIRGLTRFLERVLRLVGESRRTEEKSRNRILHKTIKKITEDIENLQYNTAISTLMTLLNNFEAGGFSGEDTKIFLKLLAPFAPHLTEELWQTYFSKRGKFKSIHLETWPKYDPSATEEKTFELVVQVNGKVRGRAVLPAGAGESEAKKAALSIENIQQHIKGEPWKVIFVPNKLINFVI